MSRVIDVNVNDWEKEILQHDALVLVDFWHERCGWCLRLDPIFTEIAEEYQKVKFTKLNVLKNPENQQLALKYGVMGTPTLVFFCDGRPVETVVGFQPKDRLKQLIEEVSQKHRECVERSTKLESS